MNTKRSQLLISALLFSAILAGCSRGDGETTRSIEEIQSQEGIPVRVRELKPETFSASLGYTSSLTGAVESTASALIGDVIEKVLVSVGDYVKKDQVVLTFPADNASLNYEQARINYENAKTSFERISRLYTAEQGISRQDYDNARTQYEIARANWDTVRKMKDVRAPVSGYLTRLNVQESDNVNPGDTLFTVSNHTRLKSTVWVTDREIGRVSVGQKASAEWRGHSLPGRVIQVDMAMDQERKAFAVKLEFDNSDLNVPSGITADIGIEVYSNSSSLIVDMGEFIESAEGPYVFLAENGVSKRRGIETGQQEGLKFEVLSGLTPGDTLITEGVNLVSDGSKIRIIATDDNVAQR
ncbi:efflux RND transporter periplasmic adaptor subunit [Marispirochaeta sp.]|uniref:efflux RND transporter periplasmic adaptor subunit n=1 Tax=Marispirochaeta sp. TaxID=2038653 RepID=UPI0029C916FE|nr:efflux RND transporter periplasmic adaptor subunit [Marispirochaeta sp.]